MCLCYVPLRYYSSGLKRWKERLHAYTNSWNSLETLSRVMLNNILLNEATSALFNVWKTNYRCCYEYAYSAISRTKKVRIDGLVIINKPYGVGSQQPCKTAMRSAAIEDNLNTAISDSDNFYLSSVLPQISEALGYSELAVVKACERFTSGITILSAREEVTSRVQKCMKKSKHQQYLSNSYMAVVLGSPKPPALSQKVGLKLETNPLDGSKQPIITNEWSRNAVSRKEVFPITIKHTTLQQSHLASLVELQPSMNKWHFLRVYTAYLLSPILGDNLYGSRVRNVLGVPLSVSPFSDTAKQSQRLSKEVLAALDLRPGDEVIIPTHLHLHRVTLLDYKGNGKHLQVQAPLPESFLWTCRQLCLHESVQISSLSHS